MDSNSFTFGCWGLRDVLSELSRKGLDAEAKARRDMKESGGVRRFRWDQGGSKCCGVICQ